MESNVVIASLPKNWLPTDFIKFPAIVTLIDDEKRVFEDYSSLNRFIRKRIQEY